MFRHASIITYYPLCSGGPNKGHPDSATRIVGLCKNTQIEFQYSAAQQVTDLILILLNVLRPLFGSKLWRTRMFSNTDDESTNGSVIYQGQCLASKVIIDDLIPLRAVFAQETEPQEETDEMK